MFRTREVRPQYPHIVLDGGYIVQLVIIGQRRRLTRKPCPWCGHRPTWRKPLRIARTWLAALACPADRDVLSAYRGPAALRVENLPDPCAVMDVLVPGIRVRGLVTTRRR